MKRRHLAFTFVFLTAAWSISNAATVSPIQDGYGEVFPGVISAVRAFRPSGDGSTTFYVDFDLVESANVVAGVDGLSDFRGSFNVTSMRIVTIEGDNVAFGSATFSDNPFPLPVDYLATADALSVGKYALAISGTGDAIGTFGSSPIDVEDVLTGLIVTAVPLPAAAWLLASGVFGLAWFGRKRLAA